MRTYAPEQDLSSEAEGAGEGGTGAFTWGKGGCIYIRIFVYMDPE